MTRDHHHQWHVAINRHHDVLGKAFVAGGRNGDYDKDARKPWMYEAKEISSEVPRLALLFKMARCGELPKVHQQCSHANPVPVPDNHLACCLGVKCHECPELKALDAMEASPEAIDEAKAWTCATHIVASGGDVAREGYLLTVDDRMFWDRVYSNLSSGNLDEEPPL